MNEKTNEVQCGETILTVFAEGYLASRWDTWQEAVDSGKLKTSFIDECLNVEEDWRDGFLWASTHVPSKAVLLAANAVNQNAVSMIVGNRITP